MFQAHRRTKATTESEWPLCVSIVAAEKGFSTSLGNFKSSNVTKTNLCDIVDSAHMKLQEVSVLI